LNEQGKLIVILDRLPGILDKGGDAGAKILSAVFSPIGAGLGAIDKVTILDNGNGGSGEGGVSKFAGSIPSIIANVVRQAQLQGVDITSILGKMGIDATDLLGMLTGKDKSSPVAPADDTQKA
jgi:hypothetical protein